MRPSSLTGLLSATSWTASTGWDRADKRTSWGGRRRVPDPPRNYSLQPGGGPSALPGGADRGGDGGRAEHDVAAGVGPVEGHGLPGGHAAQRLVELDDDAPGAHDGGGRGQPAVRADLGHAGEPLPRRV